MEDETVAQRWGWTMVAQFVRATAVRAQQAEEQGAANSQQRQAMIATLRAWRDDLFPDQGKGLDESAIIEDAPFPHGELGFDLARFEAWHAGYIQEGAVLKAGGIGLLRWFRKLAVVRGHPGVHGLGQASSEEEDRSRVDTEEAGASLAGQSEDMDASAGLLTHESQQEPQGQGLHDQAGGLAEPVAMARAAERSSSSH